MKHTTEEILLAAAIRPLAISLRDASLKKARAEAGLAWKSIETPPIQYTQAEREQADRAEAQQQLAAAMRTEFELRWNAEHPVEEFAVLALAELEKIASAITGS